MSLAIESGGYLGRTIVHTDNSFTGDIPPRMIAQLMPLGNDRPMILKGHFSREVFPFSLVLFSRFFLPTLRISCYNTFVRRASVERSEKWRSIEVVITRTTRNRLIGVELVRGFESHLLRQSLETKQFQGFLYALHLLNHF